MKRTFGLLLLPFLAALPIARAADSGPPPASSAAGATVPAYFPAFSWDRVPVYQQFADGERVLTDAEAAEIASTSGFICIEKNHAVKALGGAELGTKHEATRFKALQPGLKCLFYFNSACAYPFVTASKVFQFGKVNDQHRPFLLTDPKTGELARRGEVYYFDVLNPDFRQWWASTVGQCVRESGADGLFVDQMHGFSFLRPERKREVAAAQAELMRMAKAAIGPDRILLLNNAAHLPELFEIGDAFMLEHYGAQLLTKEAIVNDWELLKRISAAGKIAVWRIGVEVESRTPPPAAKQGQLSDAASEELSRKRLPFYLAAFLVGAQPYSYFQYGWGWRLKTGPLAAYPEFNRPLGRPRGESVPTAPGHWRFRREFEHARVQVDLDARTGEIEWR